jgi:hypothetical protein
MIRNILDFVGHPGSLHLYPRVGWARDNGRLITPLHNSLHQVQKALMSANFLPSQIGAAPNEQYRVLDTITPEK